METPGPRWTQSVRCGCVNWILLIALLGGVAAMVACPIIQLRSGRVDRRFTPLLWIMIPVVSILGVVVAFAVASMA